MKHLVTLLMCTLLLFSISIVGATNHIPPLPGTPEESTFGMKEARPLAEKAPLRDKALCAKEASTTQKSCMRINKETRKTCMDAAKMVRQTNKTEARQAVKSCTEVFKASERTCKTAFKDAKKQCKAL
jgi:hypothetical protein